MSLPLIYTLDRLNQMSQDEFTEALGSIFEHTPAIATTTWQARPFADIENLHQTMAAIVMKMTDTEKLQLICAHPDLGSKVKMADASVQEQSTIGLDRLSIEEYDRFQQLNQSYKEKFNFPYIIAVRNHTKDTILMNFMERLQNNLDTEKKQAIAEIIEIARWRLILAISN